MTDVAPTSVRLGPARRSHLRMPKRLDERAALNLLCEPGHTLCVVHTKSGDEYFVAPSGSAVTEAVARRIIRRPDIWPCDAGLLADHPQTWKLGPRR